MQGAPLPTASGSDRERVITEWDGQFRQLGMHLRTIYRDGFVCTVYEPSTNDAGWDRSRRGPLRSPAEATRAPAAGRSARLGFGDVCRAGIAVACETGRAATPQVSTPADITPG